MQPSSAVLLHCPGLEMMVPLLAWIPQDFSSDRLGKQLFPVLTRDCLNGWQVGCFWLVRGAVTVWHLNLDGVLGDLPRRKRSTLEN